MMRSAVCFSTIVLALLSTQPVFPQTAAAPPVAEAPATQFTGLLSDAELQTLVAPVALYPDTLLMQILVAATQPLEVVKSQRFLAQNSGTDPAALKTQIDAQGWDPSVAVLATAFPEVITDMADHIDWTETIGDAMLAQDDDVLAAIQVMRKQAINSGALISGAQQTVDVSDDAVVIQPTNPEVVYVPQYSATEVYAPAASGGTSATDMLLAGVIGFGTYALIDNIFDSNDDWNGYWGCRNCGGWNGAPIIRQPNIDIDRGDITLERNKVNIGNGNVASFRPGDGWKPDPDKAQGARDKIAANRTPEGTSLPIRKPDAKTDALRQDLANRAAVPYVAPPAIKNAKVTRPGSLPPAARADALRKTGNTSVAANHKAGVAAGTKPAAVQRPSAPKKAVSKPAGGQKASALKKSSSGPKAVAASKRGHASVGGHAGGGARGRR